jgi:hypothetical protein
MAISIAQAKHKQFVFKLQVQLFLGGAVVAQAGFN